MKKRFLTSCIATFALALTLGFASCDVLINQGNGLEFELIDGTYTVVGLGDYEEGILTIPSKYKGKSVTAIGESAFANEVEIGHLYIPDSVTTIGKDAFYGCPNLTKVSLGNGVTEISEKAFGYCSMMDFLELSNSLVTIGDSAFIGCERLKEFDLPESLEVISNSSFEECKKIVHLNFGANLEVIGERAFYNCVALDEVVIPDGAPTDIMKEAFFGCESIRYVSLGNSVTGVGDSAFEGNGALRELVVGDSIVEIGLRAFASCRKLYQVTLGSSLRSIRGSAFEKCWLIREIVNSSVITIRLGELEEHGGIGYYAWSVRGADEPTKISKGEDGIVYYIDGDRKAVVASEFTTHTDLVLGDDVTEIGAYAFYNEQLLKSVVIGKGCTKIGASAFRNSYKIKSVVLGENMTHIEDSAFRYVGYLTDIVIGKNLVKVGEQVFLKKVGDKYYQEYENVYFQGTEEEWKNVKTLIKNGGENDHLLAFSVSVAFYSEKAPETDGSFWHFVDGKPTLWY